VHAWEGGAPPEDQQESRNERRARLEERRDFEEKVHAACIRSSAAGSGPMHPERSKPCAGAAKATKGGSHSRQHRGHQLCPAHARTLKTHTGLPPATPPGNEKKMVLNAEFEDGGAPGSRR